MNKGIPMVRTWKVTYLKTEAYVSGTGREHTSESVIASCEVQTINKRFARWIARDIVGWTIANSAERITVSLMKGKTNV